MNNAMDSTLCTFRHYFCLPYGAMDNNTHLPHSNSSTGGGGWSAGPGPQPLVPGNGTGDHSHCPGEKYIMQRDEHGALLQPLPVAAAAATRRRRRRRRLRCRSWPATADSARHGLSAQARVACTGWARSSPPSSSSRACGCFCAPSAGAPEAAAAVPAAEAVAVVVALSPLL